MSARGVAFGLAVLLGACASPRGPAVGPPGGAEEPLPREWVELGVGAFQRDDEGESGIDDAVGYSIGGGIDFLRGDVRLGLELAFAGARYDVGAPLAPAGGAHLDARHWMVGARLQGVLPGTQLGLHLRGGMLWRDESDVDIDGLAESQGGLYYGGGVDWWFERASALGLFALVVDPRETDQIETWVGLSARFHIGRGGALELGD